MEQNPRPLEYKANTLTTTPHLLDEIRCVQLTLYIERVSQAEHFQKIMFFTQKWLSEQAELASSTAQPGNDPRRSQPKKIGRRRRESKALGKEDVFPLTLFNLQIFTSSTYQATLMRTQSATLVGYECINQIIISILLNAAGNNPERGNLTSIKSTFRSILV